MHKENDTSGSSAHSVEMGSFSGTVVPPVADPSVALAEADRSPVAGVAMPAAESADNPNVGDTVHVVGHGPALLQAVNSQLGQKQYEVCYPNGSAGQVSREDILVHEGPARSGAASASPSSPRGPRPLLYLGRPFDDPGRQIGTPSATFSLVATMVGGGVLSLPYAMSQCGILFGTIALLASALASGWTLDMLVECARSTGRDTFELVGHAAFGEGIRKFTVVVIFFLCWLSMIAYFVLLGDLLVPTAELAVPALKRLGSAETIRRVILGCAALLLSPMCYKGSLAAVRAMAYTSVGSVLLVGSMVIVRACQHLGEAHHVMIMLKDRSSLQVLVPPKYMWWPEHWGKALYAFPMFGVAFLCHFNANTTHQEFKRPTLGRMRRVLVLTMMFTSILYFCMGVFGYLYGGRFTCGNILLNFRADDPLVAVGRVFLGLVLMLNFPLICQPCRNALFRVLLACGFTCCASGQASPGTALSPQSSACRSRNTEDNVSLRDAVDTGACGIIMTSGEQEDALQPANPGPQAVAATVHVYRREDARQTLVRGSTLQVADVFAPKDDVVQQSAVAPTVLQRYVLTTVILISCLLVSYFMESILVVWSILGSTVAFLIAFILPALFWHQIVGRAPTTSAVKRCCAQCLLGVSTLLATVCTILTILNLGEPPCPLADSAGVQLSAL